MVINSGNYQGSSGSGIVTGSYTGQQPLQDYNYSGPTTVARTVDLGVEIYAIFVEGAGGPIFDGGSGSSGQGSVSVSGSKITLTTYYQYFQQDDYTQSYYRPQGNDVSGQVYRYFIIPKP